MEAGGDLFKDEVVQLAHLFRVLASKLKLQNIQLKSEIEVREKAEKKLEKSHGRLAAEVKNQSRELIEKESLFKTLISESPAGIFGADREGKCTYVNEKWCEMAGLTYEESLGYEWASATHPDDREDILSEWQERINKPEIWEREFRFLHREGTVVWAYGMVAPVLDNENNVVEYVGMDIDVTSRKRAEQELARMEKLESLSLFAGGLAHDFNNLLTSVLGNVSLAKSLMHDREHGEILEEAEGAALRARQLSSRLLAFSKRNEPERRLFSVAPVIEEAVSFALSGSPR